jgi:hypothetical protein
MRFFLRSGVGLVVFEAGVIVFEKLDCEPAFGPQSSFAIEKSFSGSNRAGSDVAETLVDLGDSRGGFLVLPLKLAKTNSAVLRQFLNRVSEYKLKLVQCFIR